MRKPPGCPDQLSAAEAVQFLTPDLLEFLTDLYGAPASIAQGAVQLLPFGSRAVLLATGLVTIRSDGAGPEQGEILQFSDLAFEVMATAADDEIDEVAAQAAAIVAARLRG
ncbi:hypothetical protein [Krasilnikovia cinnamomea]|uniref:hypothetical protein n=1 Tax=Krasilnikovia cinnamomea TaxID=349313 RepID=UPI00102AFCD5|nr:hypothetical protein [Krasilnikovia cinnamomea]